MKRSIRSRSYARSAIGSGALLSVLVLSSSPAWASGEALEVTYPQGEMSFTELAPGQRQVQHATVSNTTDTDLEVLVTSTWAQTSAAEAGVELTIEACNQAWQGPSCPGETLDIALSQGASTVGTARSGGQWDLRFVAALPADAGHEAQELSSTFSVRSVTSKVAKTLHLRPQTSPDPSQ